jgi:hypothetical protein
MLDELDDDLKPDPPPSLPSLGPVVVGGPNFLKFSLTHQTSGLPLYPALDTAWVAGQKVIAPEAGTITKHSGGPSGGYSVYLQGRSGFKYYFTHLNSEGRAGVNTKVDKGDKIVTVGSPSRFPAQRIAHSHIGINVESRLGKGRQLKYGANGNGPDYTNGAPSVGEQLEKLL